MALPALRYLDVSSLEHEGETYICLSDPEGIVENPALLSPGAFFIAACLDGEADVVDIQAAYARKFRGRMVRHEEIVGVVTHLDENGFLQSERFDALRIRAVKAFRDAPIRRAQFAGQAYPEDADELRDFIGLMFESTGGDLGPGRRAEGGGKYIRGLVVPHIDFARGGEGYATGYAALAGAGAPRTAFIFGVVHAPCEAPFVLTRKSFETPLGVVETDGDIVARIADACSWDPFADEFLHRGEHSIEFQAVMLAHLYGARTRIVPILCGPFLDIAQPEDPLALKPIERFLGACRDAAGETSGGVAVIASADLAHVGPAFGDDFDIDEQAADRVKKRDQEDLELVLKGDGPGFYRSVMTDGNARQVCGLNCIYSALRTLDRTAPGGPLLHYGCAPDPSGGIVSFASVILK